MPKQKKEEKLISEEQENISSDYRHFKDLTEDEKDTILLYEQKVAKICGKYITNFDSQYIKTKYGNCTFPNFVLNMMKLIIKNC